MKRINKLLAIVLCLAVALSSLATITFAASDNSIDQIPTYPKKAVVEFSKEGVKNTYGETYGDLSDRFSIDFNAEPRDLIISEAMAFDIYIEDLEAFQAAFSDKNITFNLSSSTTDKFTERYIVEFYSQVTQSGWNHIDVVLKAKNIDLSNVTYVYLACEGGEEANPLADTELRFANICAIAGIDYFYLPHLSVGENESEAIVTWLDNRTLEGKVVLTEVATGVETEFIATKRATQTEYNSNYATITGLKPNTEYTYRIESGTFSSDEFSLKTNDFDDSFSFIQVSDIQLDSSSSILANWNTTGRRIEEYFPDTSFIVNTGDVSDSSSALRNYLNYKSVNVCKTIRSGVVPGNHDGNSADNYYSYFFNTPDTFKQLAGTNNVNLYDYWYSYNNVLFIALNTNIKDTKYHADFITKVMEEQGDKYDWQIVLGHHSFYSASYHSKESDVLAFRKDLTPLFSELGVDLVLTGHDHVYDRSYIMNGTTPVVSDEDYAANTNGGVLYISGTTGSALKFNPQVEESKGYSAKVVEDLYGFVRYEVWGGAIRLTYYSSADMSVLDTYTLYKDDENHTIDSENDLLNGKFVEDVKLNSSGKYNLAFDSEKDISDACSMELDVFTAEALDNLNITLKDVNGNYLQKNFESLKDGWNHLIIDIDDAVVSGDIDYTNINSILFTGKANAKISVTNFFVGHVYDNGCDISCNSCGDQRTAKHDYKAVVTKATFENDGWVEYKCSGCGDVSEDSHSVAKIDLVKLSATSYTYNGATRTPTVTVKDSAGKTLKKDTDYTVSYASGRKNAGTYKVTVTFKGNYSGSKALTFKINPIKITSKFKFTLSATSYTYNGKVKSPSVTVKNANGTKLTKNTHYTVSYASGRKNVGTYKVTIKMKGNYSGSKTLTFKINPVKTTVSKLTAGKKSIKVNITKKSTQVTGYQIYCSTSKSFSSKVTKKYITSYKTTSTTLSKLSAKKTYYVKVRTYKTVNGTKYYSGWSTYKCTKTK